MFTNISWGNYIVVIVLLLASWYLFIGFRFYFGDIKDLLNGKRRLQFRSPQHTSSYEPDPLLHSQESTERNSVPSPFGEFDTTFQDVDHLIERLKTVITDSTKKKIPKQEFIDYLRSILVEYPSIKNSSFSSSVSELIVSECTKIDAIVLTQEEAEALWI
ncbi:hypothetical protein [Flavobacterium hydatis]|uniref:Uncharacterized protein n=1 Tax=Flavobacterium hydatis TaxID=991 RepID=A0A086AAN8_FLAHY|nr:hypothetical protein [Flavobacterium hydatis]KFF13752.1 hypothetical protein IW20_16850 [Flavobacterium hydatis]OXA97788.1 hypothetical protein B0A62_02725 [Flavobacterium hydatis]